MYVDFDLSTPSQIPEWGYPLRYALFYPNQTIISLIAERTDLNAVSDLNLGTALHVAARTNSMESLELFLYMKANPLICYWGTGTVLGQAALTASTGRKINTLAPILLKG